MTAKVSTIFLRRSLCKGCLTHESYIAYRDKDPTYPDCAISPIVDGKNCPCISCLIKMICENTCSKLDLHKKAGEYGEKRTL